MKRFTRLIAFACLALLASSCKDITHVQTGYISDRNDCRSRAEYGVSSYSNQSASVSGKERNVLLLQMFCECMKDREWGVAGCKYNAKDVAKAAPVQQQPTVVVVQAPPAAAVAAPAAAPAECPIPPKSKAKKRPKRKLDGTCPAPEEAAQSELDNVLNAQ